MASVKGQVEHVSSKALKGSKGTFYKIGLKIDGEWYNLNSNKDDGDKYKDKLVSFEFETGDYGNQINGKSIKAAEVASTTTHTGGPKATGKKEWEGTVGVECGQALNAATQVAIAKYGVKVTVENIRSIAEKLLYLNWEFKASYADLKEGFEAGADEQQAEPEQEPEPAPAAAPKKTTTKGSAAAKKAAEPSKAETAQTTDEFDADIPF